MLINRITMKYWHSALSAKNRTFLSQTGPSKVCKGPLQTNTESLRPTKNPPIVGTTGPCHAEGVFYWADEGFLWIDRRPLQPDRVPSQISTGHDQANKEPSWGITGPSKVEVGGILSWCWSCCPARFNLIQPCWCPQRVTPCKPYCEGGCGVEWVFHGLYVS